MAPSATPPEPTMENLREDLTEPGDLEVLFRSACMAIRKLTPCDRWADIPPPVQTAIRVIRAVRGSTGHGIFWKGHPDWLTPDRIAALDAESKRFRASAKPFLDGRFHYWTPGGEHAEALTQGEARAFVERTLGRPLGNAFATYNYYDRPGHQAYTHIDHPEYELNVLGILSHEHTGSPRSALWVYPEDQDPIEVCLEPGEVVIFHGGSTVHQRTPVGPDERVRVFTAAYLFNNDQVPFP